MQQPSPAITIKLCITNKFRMHSNILTTAHIRSIIKVATTTTTSQMQRNQITAAATATAGHQLNGYGN